MLHIPNSKIKIVGLVFGIALAGGLLGGNDASAASCEDDNVPCVEVNFGTPQGNTSVQPGLSYYDSTKFYLPVTIGLKYTSMYSVKVYGSGSSLQSDSESIPSVGTDTSYEQLGKNGSEWGIRWNFGNVIEDVETNYHRVPASESDAGSVVVENEVLPNSASMVMKHLTLGFAVSVDGEQPSGSYTNTVTVAVVASPRDARSFFDISTMQEMTPEICENTTTPVKTATTLFDTDGKHGGDANYVPETILEDVRDGKEYLVRKLADGNCWMSQNLSLKLTNGSVLTSANTDLTSKNEWTPGSSYFQQPAWDTYWTGESDNAAFSSTGNAEQGGTVGYAQRGYYYSWQGATAGSGQSTDTNSTTDPGTIAGSYRIKDGTVQDSICPKGWTLPTGGTTAAYQTNGSTKSFYNLTSVYKGQAGDIPGNTNTLYESPMSFVPAGGYYSTGQAVSIGFRQYYWSGTAYTTGSGAWILGFNPGPNLINPGTTVGSMTDILSIRCVAR